MPFKNAQEIIEAVDSGKDVRWGNDNYEVIRAKNGSYIIRSQMNGHCVGLTWSDGVTLNGNLAEFYVKKTELKQKARAMV